MRAAVLLVVLGSAATSCKAPSWTLTPSVATTFVIENGLGPPVIVDMMAPPHFQLEAFTPHIMKLRDFDDDGSPDIAMLIVPNAHTYPDGCSMGNTVRRHLKRGDFELYECVETSTGKPATVLGFSQVSHDSESPFGVACWIAFYARATPTDVEDASQVCGSIRARVVTAEGSGSSS